MKIWIRKDLKKNSIMLAFKNANEIFYGDLDPVLYIHVDIEKWTEIDLGAFLKEDQYCDNCTKQGNYDVFQCPGAKCTPERDFIPKKRVRGATRKEAERE